MAVREAAKRFRQSKDEAINAAPSGRWALPALDTGGDVQRSLNPVSLDWQHSLSTSVAVRRGQRFPGL